MDHPPIRMLFGDPVIGSIKGGSGSGYRVIGRDGQGLMRSGFLVVGNREGKAGSGSEGIGNIVSSNEFGVLSSELKNR